MVIVKNQTWDRFGNLLHEEIVDVSFPALSGYQVVAALNAALELWTIEDAAKVAGVTPDHLRAEVLAWAAAAQPTK